MGEPASSSTDAVVPPSDDTTTICGESTDTNDGGYYAFQWHELWRRVSKNPNGTTGWATIIHSANPVVLPNTVRRIHLCTFNPCQAWWRNASKYGDVGPPIHLQKVEKKCESAAVADASYSHLPLPASVPTAVAGPRNEASDLASELVPVGPAPVAEQAPVEEPASIGAPVEEPMGRHIHG